MLYSQLEANEVDRSLGGSVMEPDARIRVNETGICAHHHQLLFGMQNRLGHALLCDSHSKEILMKLERTKIGGKTGLFSSAPGACEKLAGELRSLASGCVICEDIDSHMKRYFYTFIHLWKTDNAFQRKWNESKGLCFPHAADLLEMAEDGSKTEETLIKLTEHYLEQNIEGLWQIMLEDSEPGELDDLVYNRNRNWIGQMKQIMPEKPTMFVVGAGHLPGELGVLNLLKKEGFKVEPVW